MFLKKRSNTRYIIVTLTILLFLISFTVILYFLESGRIDGTPEINQTEDDSDDQLDFNDINNTICSNDGEITFHSLVSYATDLNSTDFICGCNNGYTECKEANPDNAEEFIDLYYASLDYSCSQDSDCVVKDIHDCCGYYPSCINENAEPEPESVEKLCKISEKAPKCGFPSINGCGCIDNVCERII